MTVACRKGRLTTCQQPCGRALSDLLGVSERRRFDKSGILKTAAQPWIRFGNCQARSAEGESGIPVM